MMRRRGPLAEREPIPNSEWSFRVCPDGKNPKPSNLDVCYPSGFSPNYMMEDEFCGNPGSFFPFAKTAADRGADPRPSLQERYGSHANYVARVEEAARKLVSERFLLQEDAER